MTVAFAPPLLNTDGVGERFFGMVRGVLAPLLKVSLQDFSVLPRANLGEPFAKYSFSGGQSAVSLSANTLTMDFPKVLDVDFVSKMNLCSFVFRTCMDVLKLETGDV